MSTPLLKHRYRIIRALSEGGFGKTFLVEDTQMPSHRECVLKQLKPVNGRPEVYKIIQQRFDREAAVLEAVGKGHSQIPDLYAYFQEAGQFYLVQECVEGKPLSTLMHAPWSSERVEQLLSQVLHVLKHVHSHQIIHRDIKPDNIIVRDRDQLPCLIDFGAVKELMSTVVTSGQSFKSSLAIGTPGFMPPEQAAGRPVFASDLYSLAMTAIYLLTGKSPHQLATNSQTGQVLWQQYASQVDDRLAHVLEQATQLTVQSRYGSAESMLAALSGQSPTVRSEGGRGQSLAYGESPSGQTSLSAPANSPSIGLLSAEFQAVETTEPPSRSAISSVLQTPWKLSVLVASAVVLCGSALMMIMPRFSFEDNSASSAGNPATVSELVEAVNQNPDDTDSKIALAEAYRQEGEYDSATEQIDQVLEQLPNSSEALTVKGQLQLDLVEYEAAIETLTQAIAADEENHEAYWARGRAYFNLGQYEQNLSDFQLAREYDPNAKSLFQMIARLGRSCEPLTTVSYQTQTLFSPDASTQVYAEGNISKTVDDRNKRPNSPEYCYADTSETSGISLTVTRAGEVFTIEEDPVESSYVVYRPIAFSGDSRYLIVEPSYFYPGSDSGTATFAYDLDARKIITPENVCPNSQGDSYVGLMPSDSLLLECRYYGGSSLQQGEAPFSSLDISSGEGTPLFNEITPLRHYGRADGQFTYSLSTTP